MKKKRWYIAIAVFLVIATIAIVGLIQTGHLWARYTPTSPSEMYGSISDFYSLVYDRSDVREGTFELWPRGGERVVFDGVLERFEITPCIDRVLSDDFGILEITNKYELAAVFAEEVVPVRVILDGEEVNVPVTFRLRADQEIPQEAAERLEQLLQEGETVMVKAQIRWSNCSGSSFNWPMDSLNELQFQVYNNYATQEMREIYGPGWTYIGEEDRGIRFLYWDFYREAEQNLGPIMVENLPPGSLWYELRIELHEIAGVSL